MGVSEDEAGFVARRRGGSDGGQRSDVEAPCGRVRGGDPLRVEVFVKGFEGLEGDLGVGGGGGGKKQARA